MISHAIAQRKTLQLVLVKPVLIRVEAQGSHGYRPTDKQIADLAGRWTFAAAAVGLRKP